MDILVDTGVLLRLVIRTDQAHPEARASIRALKSSGNNLISMTQNAAEFWNVCTRPSTAKDGYELSIQETTKKLKLLERLVEFRPDSLGAFAAWKHLLTTYSVSGIQVHDARLAAAMNSYGISHILTFNGDDSNVIQ